MQVGSSLREIVLIVFPSGKHIGDGLFVELEISITDMIKGAVSKVPGAIESLMGGEMSETFKKSKLGKAIEVYKILSSEDDKNN